LVGSYLKKCDALFIKRNTSREKESTKPLIEKEEIKPLLGKEETKPLLGKQSTKE